MSATGTLLVELLTEELPPKALLNLSRAFSAGLRDGLRSRGYLEASSAHAPFATPRRLAAVVMLPSDPRRRMTPSSGCSVANNRSSNSSRRASSEIGPAMAR